LKKVLARVKTSLVFDVSESRNNGFYLRIEFDRNLSRRAKYSLKKSISGRKRKARKRRRNKARRR